MRKIFVLLTAFCFLLSACLPAALQPQEAASPVPLSDADIQATVAAQVGQTLQSLPTSTLAPSNTPVVMTATSTPTKETAVTPTETQNPTLLTLTATLGTGTVTLTAGTAGTLPFTTTPSLTPNPAFSVTPSGTLHYQYYGTMPPNLPSGSIALINMSKAEAYISLQCTTREGYVTIIEYPVGGSTVNTSAPAGRYIYVAWIGGRKFSGNFKLGKFQDLTLRMYKDRIEIK
jgi:hypothetical protein